MDDESDCRESQRSEGSRPDCKADGFSAADRLQRSAVSGKEFDGFNDRAAFAEGAPVGVERLENQLLSGTAVFGNVGVFRAVNFHILLLSVAEFEIAFGNDARGTVGDQMPVIHQNRAAAEHGDDIDVMADEQNRAGADVPAEECDAFLGEAGVADSEHLVEQENVGFQFDAGGECKAHHHAGRIGGNRLIDELADFREFDDFGELFIDLFLCQAADAAGGVDVFASGFCRVDPTAEFEQGGDFPVRPDLSGSGVDGSGDHLQKSAFSASVHAHDAEAFAAPDLERERVHRRITAVFETV